MGIEESKRKLANKIRVMPGNYNKGMSSFFGVDVSRSVPAANYATKVKAGMEEKWATNLKNAFGL